MNHFSQYIPQFVEQMRYDGKAPLTIEAYFRDLTTLNQLLAQEPPSDELLNKDHIKLAIIKLSSKNQSPKTLARYLSAWRQFCAYLVKRKLLENNPCLGIKPPKSPKRLPKAISIEKTMVLLDSVPIENELMIRDRAMFELLYSSGLRLSELTGLNLTNIDDEAMTVRVLGKGGKERIVPLGHTALDAIQAYLNVRAQKNDEAALFTSKHGNRLSNRQVQYRLDHWVLLSENNQQHIHPHMFRHSFATHMLQESKDIRAVQDLLGHSNINTTEIYTSLDFSYLSNLYDQLHPRAKRKK